MKKSVTMLLAALAGAAAGAGTVSGVWKKKCAASDDWVRKMVEFYNILNEWLTLRQQGKSLVQYFERNQYKTVAIYGMKELGERLYDELKDSDIKVLYAIDKNADSIYAEVDVLTPDDDLPEVDLIVVTPVHYFDEIKEMLADKADYPVLSIEDVVYEV